MKGILSLFLIYALFVTQAFGAIPFKPQTDEMILGKGANGQDKQITFDVGDGGSNPSMVIDDILKNFVFNKDLSTSGNVSGVNGDFSGTGEFDGNSLKLGDGTNSEQFMSFKISGEEVGFKFDPVTGEVLQKKKAGDAYKKLGTGSGSASTGINAFGEDDNANAEDGTTNWSNTGGTFTTFLATGGDAKKVIEGERSFRFTPSAQNDVVTGPTLNFDFTKFHGRTCELGIEYTGADENLELHVVNGNGAILNEDLPNNRKIQARSFTTGPFSVSFQCPTAAAIAGDANLGNLHVEIKNVGASVSPAIDWDLTYIGTDRNLGTTILPDIVTGTVRDENGSSSGALVVVDDGGFIASGTQISTGVYEVTLQGFTSIPDVVSIYPVDDNDSGAIACRTNIAPTLTTIRYSCYGTSALIDQDNMVITLRKTGADAQQKVQTYKASPVTSETVNTFTADISGALAITNETPSFIASCASNGTGDKTCTFNAGQFTNTPSVQITMFDGNGNCREVRTSDISTTSFRYQTLSSGGVVADCRVSVEVNRTLTDYKKPQTKNISLAGIAVNSYAESSQKQVRIEGCKANNNGTATIDSNSSLCPSWVSSVTRTGLGIVQWVVTGFSKNPVCSCSSDSDGDLNCVANVTSSTGVTTTTKQPGSLFFDRNINLTCIGEK